jgi:hypothetical protein
MVKSLFVDGDITLFSQFLVKTTIADELNR